MVNKDRIINEFIELVRIDSLTKHERNMADVLTQKLQEIGLEVFEDDAGVKINGNAGNLIATLKGKEDIPAILVMAHMDTVVPGIGKKPIIDGNIIKSDGTTVLGADDVAGIVSILEAIRNIKEDKAIHGDIQIAFTIAEEGGLFGAKNLDYDKIYAKYGFVLDCGGKIGTVAVRAPSQNHINITVNGKAAHAGMEPEKGIDAIKIASFAISNMKLGRIDEETTANIGFINGGLATNIVCDKVIINAEARSRDENKLLEQTEHMRHCFECAVEKLGGSYDFEVLPMYPAFNIKESDDIISILKRASKNSGIELILESTGGGSDTNIINGKGIQAVDISVGMDKVHSVEEQIAIDDLEKCCEFLYHILKAVQ